MRPGDIVSRRFVFGISTFILLTVLNFGLFVYWRDGHLFGSSWSYLMKSDGALLFGRVKLLEGGFVEVRDVYALVATKHLQGESAGDTFRLESLHEETFTLVPLNYEYGLHLGPNEVKQWGEVPAGSVIDKRLDALYHE